MNNKFSSVIFISIFLVSNAFTAVAFKKEGINPETAPQQAPFDATQCYYCNQASKYIGGLSDGFRAFKDNDQRFSDYLNTMQSLVCDIDGDDETCMATIVQVSATAYHNWAAACESQELVEKISKVVQEAVCAIMKSVCAGVEIFAELIHFCMAVGAWSVCPSPISPCGLCTKFYNCSVDTSCKFNQPLFCNP